MWIRLVVQHPWWIIHKFKKSTRQIKETGTKKTTKSWSCLFSAASPWLLLVKSMYVMKLYHKLWDINYLNFLFYWLWLVSMDMLCPQLYVTKFCTRFLLNNVYERVFEIFFTLFGSWIIIKNVKNIVSVSV